MAQIRLGESHGAGVRHTLRGHRRRIRVRASTAVSAPAAAPVSVASPASVRRRTLLWGAVVLIAAYVGMGIAVAVDPSDPFTQPLDDWWRAAVGVDPDSHAYRWFLPMFFQELGQLPGAVLTAVLIPAGLAIAGRWRSALFFLSVTLVGPGLFSQVMKNLVDRPRPAPDTALGLFGPLFTVDHGSFPSGHAVSAAALVVGVAALLSVSRARVRRSWWVIGALVMVGMVWQRTLVNAHWLSDTLTGLIAGAAAALLMWWVFWPWIRRDQVRPVWFLHTNDAKRKVNR